MQLHVKRRWIRPTSIIGVLSNDSNGWTCFTLEDPDSAGDRIPVGSYRIIIDFSNRFQKEMPHIIGSKEVDNRGIRIHCGNTQADTEGCILLGVGRTEDSVYGSRTAFEQFFKDLKEAIDNGEAVTLDVS